MSAPSLLTYYQANKFNPVAIGIEESSAAWKSHVDKRVNLYQRHLGIPLGLLAGKSILEFGCNSGENALVLASFGAELTLVEPNQQVWPRLHWLFERFGLADRIRALVSMDIDSFTSPHSFDVVLAEGFLSTLPGRDELVGKLGRFMGPAGLGVISFTDRFGSAIEFTRRAVLWRACQLAGVDPVGNEGLALARTLFGEDFSVLQTSRTFEAWWRDTLVNPLVVSQYLWSFQELLPLVEGIGCEFLGSSPAWATPDHFDWYKNVPSSAGRSRLLADQWAETLPFFLTGRQFPFSSSRPRPPDEGVLRSVTDLVDQVSTFTSGSTVSGNVGIYPEPLHRYLLSTGSPELARFSRQMQQVYAAAATAKLQELLDTYRESALLRQLWGAPYHYLSFARDSRSS